jgi:hypothetical protein
MAGPRAFPNIPSWVWEVSFCLSAIVVIVAGSILAYDFFVRPRLKGQSLDPFLATAMAASLIAFVFLGIYVLKGSAIGVGLPGQAVAAQPEITLQVPKNRYEFRWDPTQSMQIITRLEGETGFDRWNMPAFILRNLNSVGRT